MILIETTGTDLAGKGFEMDAIHELLLRETIEMAERLDYTDVEWWERNEGLRDGLEGKPEAAQDHGNPEVYLAGHELGRKLRFLTGTGT